MNLKGQKCYCRTCGLRFRSPSAFDKHRSGPADNRICLDPADIGMVCKEGWWITRPMATKPAFLAARMD